MVTESVSSITSCTASLMRFGPMPWSITAQSMPMNVVAMSTYDHRAARRRRSRMSDRPKMTSPRPFTRAMSTLITMMTMGPVGLSPTVTATGLAKTASATNPINSAMSGAVITPSRRHKNP